MDTPYAVSFEEEAAKLEEARVQLILREFGLWEQKWELLEEHEQCCGQRRLSLLAFNNLFRSCLFSQLLGAISEPSCRTVSGSALRSDGQAAMCKAGYGRLRLAKRRPSPNFVDRTIRVGARGTCKNRPIRSSVKTVVWVSATQNWSFQISVKLIQQAA